MLHSKSKIHLFELTKYFDSNSSDKAFHTLYNKLCSLKVFSRWFAGFDKCNTKYGARQLLACLMLFPVAAVKDVSHFAHSRLYASLGCGKDVFYNLLNSAHIEWRTLAMRMTMQLITEVENNTTEAENNITEVENNTTDDDSANSADPAEKPVRCLIADDTDLPKRGRCMELVSRIYSHVTGKYLIGFKGLFLGYHDGKSFFGLDFSLHGEKGSNKDKPYGMTPRQLKRRYTSKRPKKSPAQQRVNDYFQTKPITLIAMIRSAIAQGIRFDYLLTDSWFTCYQLLKFIATRRIGCHFLGMVKNGTTKYDYNGRELTLAGVLRCRKATKAQRCRTFNCHFYEVQVRLKNLPVKLFFCKTDNNKQWKCLITTNVNLEFKDAFKIYATRWCIEVFFKECKQLLRMGKCESRHFEAQIAATTITMLQYNLLSTVKRFDGYETLGMLFRQANAETLELTIKERILLIIKEILNTFVKNNAFGIDYFIQHYIIENDIVENLLDVKSIV
jgi:hypothetical protein